MTEYVAGLLFSYDCLSVALIRKRRPSWQAGRLNAIGGHIEPGETPLDAMKREANEEAGIPLETDWQSTVILYGPNDEYVVHFFAATGDVHTLQTLTDEKIERFDVRGLADNHDLMPNLRYILHLSINEATKPGNVVEFPIIITERNERNPRVSVFT